MLHNPFPPSAPYINVGLRATCTASSYDPDGPCTGAIDDVIQPRSGKTDGSMWHGDRKMQDGGRDWIRVYLTTDYDVASVEFYHRCSIRDQCSELDVTLNDLTTLRVRTILEYY